MQKQENFSFEGHLSTFCIKMSFGIGHPPPTHQLQSTCAWEDSRVPNLQTEFNYLDSFKSYGILVISLSPWSPHCPLHPHIVLVIPMSSPLSPCCPHSPQKVPMWFPWLWSLWSPPHVVPVLPIIPTLSPSFPHHPHSPQKVPMWSPWLWSLWSPPHVVPWSLWSLSCPHRPHCSHIIPVIPKSSPHHLEGPHIIPNPPDTHCTHPHPLGGWGAPNQ